MRVQSNAREVPYCDCFSIDEEMIIHMPNNCSNSAVLRVTMTPVWHQKTMMKSVIQSNAVKEAKNMWAAYGEYVKDNGHLFKEKKKESKIGHGIEPARVPQAKEDEMEGLS